MILRIKGVKQGKSKSGRIYYYHRKTGTPLPGQPGTTEFMDTLARINANDTLARIKAPASDTLGALIGEYKSSPEWNDRAPRTQDDYGRVFNYLAPLGRMPLKQIDSGFLYALRDKAMAAHKRRFANYTLQVLRLLFNWAIRRGRLIANPAAAVELVKRPRNAPEANRPWTPEELDAVLVAAPPELRVAIALGAFVGLREGDVVTVSWANYDGQAFEVKTAKTGEWIDVRAHYRLREILDATPRLSPNIVVGARGRPYTLNGFRSRFFRLVQQLEADGKVGPDLTFHGLRHTIGTWLAEAECDPRTIGAVLGQKSTAMSDHYSRRANRKRLAGAAIERLEEISRSRRKEPA